MFRYGFELEGFYYATEQASAYTIPPKGYPTDGFPGLVEIRTYGGSSLDEAYANLLMSCWSRIDFFHVDFGAVAHSFSAEERRELRARPIVTPKTPVTVRNIYGKKPRALGNKTIASLQINISNLVREEWTDSHGSRHYAQYGLLDIPNIIQRLDEEFKQEIASSGRQPGEYAIKGRNAFRLEYRSLPNKAAVFDLHVVDRFLKRIKKAVEGK